MAIQYSRDASVHELFLRQAQAQPEAPAVTDPAGTLTYGGLADRSARLARRITAHGVRPGELVAVRAERSADWIVANLAVLRAGAAFLPISPADPAQRVDYLLGDAEVRLVLGDEERPDAAGRTEMSIAADLPGTGELPDSVAATAPAYVMYTSGSTGRPKGVLVCHRNVVRLVSGTDYVPFSPDMRVLVTGAVSFDATTFEVWGPLLNGGSLVLPGPDVIFDADRLAAALAEHAITTMWLTSPLFSRLVRQNPAAFATLSHLVVGGDVVDGRHVAEVLARTPRLRVVNGYGPTENTTFSCTHVITLADTAGDIPIGRPIAHSTAYVRTPDGREAGPGEEGELFVGGDGVALGYLNRPELTDQVFRPDPFVAGGRLYRTGDLARRRPDGVLEFLGRADGQVKIRGFRIEPGEIEAVLRAHPAVADAIVIPRVRPGDDPTDRYLCAYLTAVSPVGPDELREHLVERVPRHLVPGHLVVLDELPLTAHGKVDRAQLPDPAGLDLPVEYVPARDEVEERLVTLWEAQLPGATVGVLESIFDHGLDSLSAATLAAAVSREFEVGVSMADIFRCPTIEELAILLAERRGEDAEKATVTATPADATYPLTPQQHPLYVEQMKDLGSVRYNIPLLLDLPAGTDPQRLADAWRALVRRHDALRTTFTDGPVQTVHDYAEDADVDADVAVLPHEPDLAALIRPFDLAAAPPVRARIHHFDGRTVLFADLHHLVVDGLSLVRLFGDLDALYRGTELPAVALSYRDFAHWAVRGAGRRAAEEQRAHWKEAFDGWVRSGDLPTDRPRPAAPAFPGAVHTFQVPPPVTAALRAVATRSGTTPFAPLAAAYAVFLTAITGHDDVTVGVPAAGRTMPGATDAVGMFVNTVCLRVRTYQAATFADLVAQVSATAREAFAHQDFPFPELAAAVEPQRAAGRNPVFDTMLALQSGALHQSTLLGAPVQLRPLFTGQTMFDLNMQVYEESDHLDVGWEYSTELFEPATVASFADLLLDILARALDQPTLSIAALATAPAPTAAPATTAITFDL